MLIQPVLLVTISVTVYNPTTLYICDGFCSVDVAPSPKSQSYAVIVPTGVLDRSVKLTVAGTQLIVTFD